MAEDLADLFELELDKLANQYEMQQRAEQQGGDKQVDELAEKLKELARRQQQEAERQRRLAAANQGGARRRQRAASGSWRRNSKKRRAGSKQLTPRAADGSDLQDAARQLQDAANAMRQAAASGSRDGGAQASAALDKLRQAQQRLQNNQSGRGERDVQDAHAPGAGAGRRAEARSRRKSRASNGQQGAARQAKAQCARSSARTRWTRRSAQLQDQIEKLANDARR